MLAEVPVGWQAVPLAGCMEAIIDYRGKSPRKSSSGVPLITAKLIKGGRILQPKEFIRVEDYDAWMRRGIPKPGDVVMTTEAPLGEIACLNHRKVALAQRVITLRGRRRFLDNGFLRYSMQSKPVQDQLRARATGTTVLGIRQSELRKVLLFLPPYAEQQAIGRILGALDDKIELNRKMNRTLEATAQTIFRSWFVDFDPVVAKVDGRKPSGLSDEFAALFPDRFEGSELGPIPEGWEVTRLKEMASKIGSGATPRGGKAAYVDEGIALIRSQNVYDSEFRWNGLARITDEQADRLKGVTVERGDILLNITGASILRTCVVEPEVLPARVNQHVAIIRAADGMVCRFLHQHLLRSETKALLLGMNAGGSREAITKRHIESVLLPQPPPRVLRRFEEIVGPLFSKKECNTAESRNLASLRDLLLPKLLSGEIRVGQAEEAVEEVI